ncbi:MAG: DUF4214 domain-containing protein [Huintestinicola sp.]
MKFKRTLSGLLALFMAVSMTGISAAAEETISEFDLISNSVKIGTENPDSANDISVTKDASYYSSLIDGLETKFDPTVTKPQIVDFSMEEAEAINYFNEMQISEYEASTAKYEVKAAKYNFSTDYYYNQLNSDEKKLYDGLKSVAQGYLDNAIDVTESGGFVGSVAYDRSKINDLKLAVITERFFYDNPQYFFVDWWFGRSGASVGNIMYVSFHINDDYQSAANRTTAINQMNSVTDTWMATLDTLSSDVAKETWIAKKLCDTVVYTSRDGRDQTAIRALVDGKCVCNGYAMAFAYMCNACGINTICVTSADHAWNRTYLQGKWYCVDTTWMDTKVNGSYSLDWLNKSEAYFLSKDPVHHAIATSEYYELTLPECNDNDPVAATVDKEKAEAFVERLYTKLLGRASDATGKANHVNKLMNGTSAVDVAKGFVLSTELANKKLTNREFVKRMYLTMLDRNPDSAGLTRWATALDNGCSYGYVLAGFSTSAEFTKLCQSYGITRGTYVSSENRDKNANLTAYVSRMYTKALGRSYDVKGLNNHTGRYIAGTRDAKGIAHDFFFSTEFVNRKLTNDAYINTLYQALFNRAADAKGKANWTTRMNSGWTREQVFNGFTSSAEFKNLVASFGI